MKRFRSPLALLTVLLWIGAAWSQTAGINTAKHNFNGQGCISCHIPRTGPAAAPEGESACDTNVTWDCDLRTRTFQTYDSAASQKPGSTAAPRDDTEARMSSLLCASCHDGVGTPSMTGTPGFNGHNGSAAKGLRNEHPINVPYDPTKDPTLAALASVSRLVKLFGQGNTVQCSSCHDVHDSVNQKFLRIPNKDSALCITCHL